MKVISVLNNKGGVGKTTSAYNLAYELTNDCKKVLLIDLDSQANLTSYAGLEITEDEGSFNILSGEPVSLQTTQYCNLWIIPSSAKLISISNETPEYMLKDYLQSIIPNDLFDFVILDCPPSIGVITINALVASTQVVIPTKLGKLDLDGFVQLFNVIESIRNDYNPYLSIAGVFITMYRNIKFYQKIHEDLKNEIGDMLLNTVISESVTVPRSHFEQKPIGAMSKNCKVSKEYRSLAGEILCHI